jgi:hypothetical protein
LEDPTALLKLLVWMARNKLIEKVGNRRQKGALPHFW